MKKIFSLVILLVTIVPAVGYAQSSVTNKESNADVQITSKKDVTVTQPVMSTLTNPLKVKSLADLYTSILKIIVEIGYVVAGFFILLSGFKFVTAQGNESKIEDAKKTFYGTIIGTVIVIGANVIFAILKGVITGLTK